MHAASEPSVALGGHVGATCRLTRAARTLTIERPMKRLPCTSALLLASACFAPPDVSESLSAGLMPVTSADPATDSDPTSGDPTEGSADGPSSGDTPVPPTCTDGAQGEDETDVDCGGSCGPCDNGQGCLVPEDCSSGACEGEVCVSPTCGDGVIDAGEACDDTGESAACNIDCTAAACGDGVLNVTAGEACDDAGESATCNTDCTAAACGDGVPNVTAGEACDEGGSTAACDADCTAVLCGDGFVNAATGEACDDAGESAACNTDCTMAACGDGLVNTTAGEECEAPEAFCDADCLYTGCQPDPVALAMAACMAAYPNCTPQNGGIVGHGAGVDVGSNCGTPAHPWRWYCTVTSDATNYNCSACTVGEILGAHDPCNCDPGTSPVLDSFCM
jgi:hypothetical protein